jgi:hypothetical protein
MKKFFISTGLLILLFLFLMFQGCKSADEEYDIRGTWNHTSTILTTATGTMTFTGTNTESGNCTENTVFMSGTWTRTGTSVVVTLVFGGTITYIWRLTIENNNLMSGTVEVSILPGVTGPSTLTR